MGETDEVRRLGGAARWVRVVCASGLVVAAGVGVGAAWRWPLVGDASLMHYVVFLRRAGMVPYREIHEVNLPGSFLAEAMAMRVFGEGARGWRAYDLALLVLMLVGMWMVAGRRRWFAAVFAGGLFALVHLQDGLAQGGQRDLLMAVLLVWGMAALLLGMGGWRPEAMVFLAGLLVGATGTIKPVLLPLGLAMVLLAAVRARRWRVLVAGLVGLSVPLVVMTGGLWRRGALPAFWGEAVPLMRWHAAMGRRGVGFLLTHAVSPVWGMVGLGLVYALRVRPRWTMERVVLAVGIVGTAMAYGVQGKGYPYQRYPLLGVLLLLIGLVLEEGLLLRGWRWGMVAVMIAFGSLALGPWMAWKVTTFSPATPFQDALRTELGRMGGAAALDGQVQCLDTFGGCVGVLYDLRVRQATGFLYDCYLFADGDPDGVRTRYRAAFLQAFGAARPRVVVVTNQFCFGDGRGFGKMEGWPEFAGMLGREYEERLDWRAAGMQHWWSRREMPAGFRVYVRR